MIKVDTSQWPYLTWVEIINWCIATFGPCKEGEWMWIGSGYDFFISEKNLTLLLLRWS